MPEYKAPLRDMQFILNDVFHVEKLWQTLTTTQEVTPDLADAILEEGAKICENELLPLNRSGDEEGCQFDNGVVTTPKGFKAAYQTYVENGWQGLGGDTEYGGQGMPKMLTAMFEEMLYSANCSFTLYPALTSGACLAVHAHASEELKTTYLPKMYEGVWAGAMCLTEPHCGTDLGLIRTKAIPAEEGGYKITGTKIFITGGEQDLSENIIHLVLAKLPDAPAGTRGISLFLVPKIKVNDDGSLGDGNGVSCGSIEHKMGIKASSTCVMNFDDAHGYLIGEPHKGLAAMFTMMNYERLSIGLQGIGLGEISYQNALAYAKERIQGRAATGAQQKDKAADSILVHPDVRRMLLTQKAYNEGARCFAAYTAMQLDVAKGHPDEKERAKAHALVSLLTPVAKAYFTDRGFDVCVLGQQVLGGHGFIREWGQEQYVRDARIAQIYEGTNGIQALDLMGRKVVSNHGELFHQFYEEVSVFADSQDFDPLPSMKHLLKEHLELLKDCTEKVIGKSKEDPNIVGSASCDYLNLFGLTAYTYMWARMISVVEPETEFGQSKIKTAEFFLNKILPEAKAYASKVLAGADSLMAISEEEF